MCFLNLSKTELFTKKKKKKKSKLLENNVSIFCSLEYPYILHYIPHKGYAKTTLSDRQIGMPEENLRTSV